MELKEIELAHEDMIRQLKLVRQGGAGAGQGRQTMGVTRGVAAGSCRGVLDVLDGGPRLCRPVHIMWVAGILSMLDYLLRVS